MTSHFQELSKQTSYEIYLIDFQLHRNEDEHYICNTSILFKYTVKTIKKCCYCRGCPHTNGLIPGVTIILFTTTPQLSLLFILNYKTCSFIVPQCYIIFYRSLSSIPAPRLGALAIEEALKRAAVEKDSVDEVYMGNVLPASMGQAPDRQACIFAGIKWNFYEFWLHST